jgi:coenzyme PQQ biosynthesis protein PqqD
VEEPAFLGSQWRSQLVHEVSKDTLMIPSDTSQPRLAVGCRWGGSGENRVILFPEGKINLQSTGLQVLERCDGKRTFGEIITELQKEFGKTDPEKIRSDIGMFLEQLQRKRIVDY